MKHIQNLFRMTLVLIVMLALPLAQAQSSRDNQDVDSQDESSIRKVARQRQYPGGADVEPLKVQEQLPQIKKDGDNDLTAPEPVDAD